MSFTSFKWISAEVQAGKRILSVNERETTPIFARLGNHPCNLVSVFGRARQGKSFLMNCLAGERDIFRISNEKESCTQGIDVSDKWLDLSEFSRIDGGRSVAGAVKVGFVDAEGQGDKNVTYDATLVCPILLISKCVLFNWKGDLQKDHILESLGVMTRAASNVEAETFAASSRSSEAPKSKFAHLHIVFRDWQAVGSDSASVYEALFRPEGTVEGASRDLIRTEVLRCFASVRVWLFDAPTDSARDLRSKLTIEMTTPAFRAQLRELRAALANQLREPLVLGNHQLTGRSLGPVIRDVAQALNNGEVILPHSAFINMLKVEIHQLRQRCEEAIHSSTAAALDHAHQLAHRGMPADRKTALGQHTAAMQTLINSFTADLNAIVDVTTSGEFAREAIDDAMSSLTRSVEAASAHFLAGYQNIFAEWMRNARQQAEALILERLRVLKDSDRVYADSALVTEIDAILHAGRLLIGNGHFDSSPEYADADRQLVQVVDLHGSSIKTGNASKLVSRNAELESLMNGYLGQLLHGIPSTIQRLQGAHPLGLPSSVLEQELNSQYETCLTFLLSKASYFCLDNAAVEQKFEASCANMNRTLKVEYNAARDRAIQAVVAASLANFDRSCSTTFSPYIDDNIPWNDSTEGDQAFRTKIDQFTSELDQLARRNVSGWALGPADLDRLLIAPLSAGVQEIVGRINDSRQSSIMRGRERHEAEEEQRSAAEEQERQRQFEEQRRRKQQAEEDEAEEDDEIQRAANIFRPPRAGRRPVNLIDIDAQIISANSWATHQGMIIDDVPVTIEPIGAARYPVVPPAPPAPAGGILEAAQQAAARAQRERAAAAVASITSGRAVGVKPRKK